MNKQNDVYDAVIIGAGPAGLMAAIISSQNKHKVLLLEKNELPGKKLLISGKGRCNITNGTDDIDEFMKNFSHSGKFLHNCFHIFSNNDLISFFEENGVPLKSERGKRIFPKSDDSRDVLNALIGAIRNCGAPLLTGLEVISVKKVSEFFETETAANKTFLSRKLVIATGGLSYPKTGSTGFGLIAAKKFGHTIEHTKPALMGLNLKSPISKEWQGISLKNVSCSTLSKNKKIDSRFGEMLLTHYGVSGPIIFDLSAGAYDYLECGKPVDISIDFKPALAYDTLTKRILREFEENKNKAVVSIIKNLLPQQMAAGFLDYLHIIPSKKTHQITKKERSSIIKALKDFRLSVHSTRPLEEAIVTRGGISTKEINPKTMESRLIKGLFFAGEVIDVDAKTGGYNMQAAFSTGFVAGGNL